MDSYPNSGDLERADERFAGQVLDWSHCAEEFGVCDSDGDSNPVAVKSIARAVGYVLRSCDPDELRELLVSQLGLDLDIKDGSPSNKDGNPLLHDHQEWEVPESVPKDATTWTVSCTHAGCHQKRRVMRD